MEKKIEIVIREAGVAEVKECMRGGVLKFAFRKKDGSVRVALGTLQRERFSYVPEGPARVHEGLTTYFDMERGSFRSFLDANLVGIVQD